MYFCANWKTFRSRLKAFYSNSKEYKVAFSSILKSLQSAIQQCYHFTLYRRHLPASPSNVYCGRTSSVIKLVTPILLRFVGL